MKKIFVFDTETTGLLKKKEKNTIHSSPRIIQFAGIFWIFEKGTFTESFSVNEFIHPQEPISSEVSRIHHIYEIDVKDAPPLEKRIDDFLRWFSDADILVWHNIEYDMEVLKGELRRLDKIGEFHPKHMVCTMKMGALLFDSMGENKKKWRYLKLDDLYHALFWEYMQGAHNAYYDVRATLQIFLELVKRWIIRVDEEENQHQARLFF